MVQRNVEWDSSGESSKKHKRGTRHRQHLVLYLLVALLLLNVAYFYINWYHGRAFADLTIKNITAINNLGVGGITRNWVENYVKNNGSTQEISPSNSILDTWVTNKISSQISQTMQTAQAINVTNTTTIPTTTSVINSTSALTPNDCAISQTLKWSGTAWVCANDTDMDTNTTYNAGNGLELQGETITLDLNSTNDWTGIQTFSNGLTLGNNTFTNLAGTGLDFNNGVLASTLGTSVDINEIANNSISSTKILNGAVTSDDLADSSVTTAKLSQSGCANGNVLKWQTSSWVCANDNDSGGSGTTYSAGTGLALDTNTNTFAVDTTASLTWVNPQDFSGGLTLGGNTYTSLAGGGLSFSGGALHVNLGNSIETAEVTNGAITDAKLAGLIGLDKIGQNGCTANQTLKWSGAAWACAGDNDTIVLYSAGNGLSLNSNAFSLNTAASQTWSANQTFTAGLTVGGNTYTNLAGSGLVFSSGVLSTALGTTIESGEITDGTITSADIAPGVITANNIANDTITAANMTAAARKRVATINVSIAASLLTAQEQALFIAPTNGTITKVIFTSGNTVSPFFNQGTISVERKTATIGTVASLNLASNGLTSLTPVFPALNSGLNFSTGDLYTFRYAPGIIGLTINNLLVSVEYTLND